MEQCRIADEYAAFGPTAVSVCAMESCMKEQGLQTAVFCGREITEEGAALKTGDVAVLATTQSGRKANAAEFCTFKQTEQGLICAELPTLTMKRAMEERQPGNTMLLKVTGRRANVSIAEEKRSISEIDKVYNS